MSNTINVDGVPVATGTYEGFKKLASAFKAATGYTLLITSGYRSYAEQKSLYDRWKAGTFNAPSVAPPGTSLHENGRALDVRDSGSSPGVTVAGNARSNWLRANAAKYGFAPTGYGFGEPWHIEYQGTPWSKVTSTASTYNPNRYNAAYIKRIQNGLIMVGISVGDSGADGILGKDTFNAIKTFQKRNSLVQDGIPGPKTRSLLTIIGLQKIVKADTDGVVGEDTKKRLNAIKMSSTRHGKQFPYGVKYVQSILGVKQDDVWGDKSKAAHDEIVKRIQRVLGISVDGIWGPATDSAIGAYLK